MRLSPAPAGHGGLTEPRATTNEAAMARFLIILGVVLVALGLLWPWLGRLGLGHLPGDIVVERENFRLYVPITTSLLASLVLSLILWLIGR